MCVGVCVCKCVGVCVSTEFLGCESLKKLKIMRNLDLGNNKVPSYFILAHLDG